MVKERGGDSGIQTVIRRQTSAIIVIATRNSTLKARILVSLLLVWISNILSLRAGGVEKRMMLGAISITSIHPILRLIAQRVTLLWALLSTLKKKLVWAMTRSERAMLMADLWRCGSQATVSRANSHAAICIWLPPIRILALFQKVPINCRRELIQRWKSGHQTSSASGVRTTVLTRWKSNVTKLSIRFRITVTSSSTILTLLSTYGVIVWM